jgi:hypothetical protein
MALLSGALALCIALPGCGGDASAGSAEHGYVPEASTTVALASPPLTKSRFLAHMNKTCRAAWPRIAYFWTIYRRTHSPTTGRKQRFADAVQKTLLPTIDFLIFDDIHMLGSPPGQEETLERIIGPKQVAVELGEKRRWSAYSIGEVVKRFDTYDTRARRYGLDDCLVNRGHLRRIEA